MLRREIIDCVSEKVSQETEIPVEVILSRDKTYEAVDARYLLVYFLSCFGMSPSSIAKQCRMTPQGVRQILRNFDQRRKQGGKIFEITFQQLKKQLGIN